MPRKNIVEEKKRKDELIKVIISNHMQLSDGSKAGLLQVFVLEDASESQLRILNTYQRFLVLEEKKALEVTKK